MSENSTSSNKFPMRSVAPLGVIAMRRLHTNVLAETGLSTADEMLYPENYRYLSDLLSYVAVGARSVENQEHRLVASGIGAPVGMKNPTGGDLSVMMNAIKAGQHSHVFLYRGWEVQTQGNPLTHAILRGYTDYSGKSISNYHYEDLVKLKVCDGIIAESAGGAHNDPELTAENSSDYIFSALKRKLEKGLDELLNQRYNKYRIIGEFQES